MPDIRKSVSLCVEQVVTDGGRTCDGEPRFRRIDVTQHEAATVARAKGFKAESRPKGMGVHVHRFDASDLSHVHAARKRQTVSADSTGTRSADERNQLRVYGTATR